MRISPTISLHHYQKACEAEDYIREHISERELLSIDALAKQFGICQTLLMRSFKYRYKTTIHHYIIQTRVNKAKQFLHEEGLQIKEISERLGYTEISHFTRDFTKVTGIPPNQYRNQQMKKRIEEPLHSVNFG